MKSEVFLRYLSHLQSKKEKRERGFTLIELLVVVIIIGVLAAVALPNLVGQIGKARETEAKNAIGSLMRAAQDYHFEKGTFPPSLTSAQLQANNSLGVIIPPSKYYTCNMIFIPPNTIIIICTGINQANVIDNGASKGTRNYISAIEFDPTIGNYGQIICRSDISGTPTATVPASGVVTIGTTAGTGCAAGDSEIK